MDFATFFHHATNHLPYRWQERLAKADLPDCLEVATGYGKTEGLILTWAFHRLCLESQKAPRHLIYCLPMRALVHQTAKRARRWFQSLGQVDSRYDVRVYTIVGGPREGQAPRDTDGPECFVDSDWARHPEKPWVLIGTQDQLLSRALNRGYGMSRFQWSIHFGLLNNDCQWVLDEVQLMGPGASTAAQLDWLRRQRARPLLPCTTTWASATLTRGFLDSEDRRQDGMAEPGSLFGLTSQEEDEDPGLRLRALAKVRIHYNPALIQRRKAEQELQALATQVRGAHRPGTLTLVVLNTVLAAQKLAADLGDVLLLTARFRHEDRREGEQELQELMHKAPAAGRIVVATQVVEAGLDLSAEHLFSELCPFPSVVQRLGRCNRDGLANERAQATFFWPLSLGKSEEEAETQDEKERIGPYARDDLERAEGLVKALVPLSQELPLRRALTALRQSQQEEFDQALAQRGAIDVPRAADVFALFSIEADLSGGFTDISAFVRDADGSPDVEVFYRDWKSDRAPTQQETKEGSRPRREERCPVPVGVLRKFLADHKGKAFTWDDRAGCWRRQKADEIRPGMVVLLPASAGGYSRQRGFTGDPQDRLDDVPPPGPWEQVREDRQIFASAWVSLDEHLRDTGTAAHALVTSLRLPNELARAVVDAARYHDLGKAHPVWQEALGADRPAGTWAKAQQVKGVRFRPGLRHEAATALAMWYRYLRGEADFCGLAVYLAAAHHGKVRTVLTSRRGRDVCGVPPRPEALDVGGQRWPMDFTVARDGLAGDILGEEFVVTGLGWTGLVADLLGRARPGGAPRRLLPGLTGTVSAEEPQDLGPFALAYLEALVRIADWRASEDPQGSR